MRDLPILLDVLGLLGLGALGAATLTTVSTARRDRRAARRDWLDKALAAFYVPVYTKLELGYQWNEQLRRERAERGSEPADADGVEVRVERKLVLANVELRAEVRKTVEANLHYVESPELRAAALTYLRDVYVDEWRQEVSGIVDALASDRGIILMPVEQPQRETLHQLVKAEFERLGAEFRTLSEQ